MDSVTSKASTMFVAMLRVFSRRSARVDIIGTFFLYNIFLMQLSLVLFPSSPAYNDSLSGISPKVAILVFFSFCVGLFIRIDI